MLIRATESGLRAPAPSQRVPSVPAWSSCRSDGLEGSFKHQGRFYADLCLAVQGAVMSIHASLAVEVLASIANVLESDAVPTMEFAAIVSSSCAGPVI